MNIFQLIRSSNALPCKTDNKIRFHDEAEATQKLVMLLCRCKLAETVTNKPKNLAYPKTSWNEIRST